MAKPTQRCALSRAVADPDPIREAGSGDPAAACGPGAGRLLPLLGRRGGDRGQPARPPRPWTWLRGAHRLRGYGAPVRTQPTERWGIVRVSLQTRTHHPRRGPPSGTESASSPSSYERAPARFLLIVS